MWWFRGRGRLGLGIVYAMRDRWQDSANSFKSVQERNRKPTDPDGVARNRLIYDIVRSNERFVLRLREAVYRNEVNSKGAVGPLPQFLRVFGNKGSLKPPDKTTRNGPMSASPENPPAPE